MANAEAITIVDFEKTIPLPDDALILRRPHFRLVQNELFFLISRRPYAPLAELEAAVWQTLAREQSVQQLRGQFGPSVDQAVGRLLILETCELVEPRFPINRRKILVIEPHCDDAVLSVGGTMWLRHTESEFEIATLASRSNFTSYYDLDRDFFSIDAVTRLRAAEGALVARILGGKYVPLGLSEAVLRYHDKDWSQDWFSKHEMSVRAATNRFYSDEDIEAASKIIEELLAGADAEEIWIPLGVGRHSDHQLTRDSCLRVLLRRPSLAVGKQVLMYKEIPYASRDPQFSDSCLRTLIRAGAEFTPCPVRISDQMTAKMRLVSIFASQFKLAFMRPEIEQSSNAVAADGTGPAEFFWRIDRLPTKLGRYSFAIGDPLFCDIKRVCNWRKRHADASKIRILLLVPCGRWERDLEELVSAFPNSSFDVFAHLSAAAEVEDVPSRRVHVHRVGGGPKSWIRLALKLAVSSPEPTLFLTGPNRVFHAKVLAKLWPMSDTLLLPTMDYFLIASQVVKEGP